MKFVLKQDPARSLDRLLAEEEERGTDRDRAISLLDRGHFDEAREVLARLSGDRSALLAFSITSASAFRPSSRGKPPSM